MCEEIESNDESVNEMDEMVKEFYVYVYLDPRKEGKYVYGEFEFDYEPFYVGKGKDDRKFDHMMPYMLKVNNLKSNKIKKIIREGFQPIVIEYKNNLTNEEAIQLEIKIITTIGRIDLKTGPLVNFTDGGEGMIGYIISEETKNKMSKAKLGRKLSEETKNKMGEFQRQRFENMTDEERIAHIEKCKNSWTDERKQKYSEKFSGENNPNYGKKLSEESKLKISEKLKSTSCFVTGKHKEIIPVTGNDHGLNKYLYYVFDLEGELLYKEYSLLILSNLMNTSSDIIKKFSKTSNFFKKYFIVRQDKEIEEDFKLTDEMRKRIQEYKVRYFIGQKLGFKSTKPSYYLYKIYKDNELICETYYPNDIEKQFSKRFRLEFIRKIYENGKMYGGYYMIKYKLGEDFLNETD